MQEMRVLGLIPARGGSKGVPRKNVRLLRGRPLLEYTAEAARSARRLVRTILSTEDAEIAEVGRRCGLEVPFLRPEDLARDNTPTLPVVQHALAWLEKQGDSFDAVCILQPTCPVRRSGLIDDCIDRLEKSGADSVVTVLPVPPEHNPHWVYFSDAEGFLHLSTGEKTPRPRRQDLPPAFHREGSVYVIRRRVIMEENTILGNLVSGYAVDPSETVNIDEPEDWERAERLLASAAPAAR
jgi:CMP-N,N'-diacetyllegionaminic acid synthase